jgi:hypothetical protein
MSGVTLKWASGALRFDFVSEYSYPGASEIASFPVEDGPNVTDHVDVPLAPFTFSTIVSNTPLYTDATNGGRLGTQQARGIFLANERRTTKKITPPKSTQIPGPLDVGAAIRTVVKLLSKGDFQQPWIEFGAAESRAIEYLATAFDPEFDTIADVFDTLQRLHDSSELIEVITDLRTIKNCVVASLERTRTKETGAALSATITMQPIRIVQTRRVPRPIPTQGRVLAKGKKDAGLAPKQPKKSLAALLADRVGADLPTVVVPET